MPLSNTTTRAFFDPITDMCVCECMTVCLFLVSSRRCGNVCTLPLGLVRVLMRVCVCVLSCVGGPWLRSSVIDPLRGPLWCPYQRAVRCPSDSLAYSLLGFFFSCRLKLRPCAPPSISATRMHPPVSISLSSVLLLSDTVGQCSLSLPFLRSRLTRPDGTTQCSPLCFLFSLSSLSYCWCSRSPGSSLLRAATLRSGTWRM